jgi:hypothetical protein
VKIDGGIADTAPGRVGAETPAHHEIEADSDSLRDVSRLDFVAWNPWGVR